MKTKAEGNGWVLWLIGFIVVAIFVVVLIVFNQDTKINSQEQQSGNVDLYLRALEPNTKVSIQGNYRVSNFGTELAKGSLTKESYTLIEDISINKTEIYCSSQNHYSTLIHKEFTPEEKLNNLSKVDCIVERIGKIVVKTNKNLIEGGNIITLTITSAGTIKKPTMCVAWTPGVISVNKENPNLVCPDSVWVNYSGTYLDEKSKLQYTWLPENTYQCTEKWVEKCQSVFGSHCSPIPLEEPARLKNKVDKCWRIAGEIKNSELSLNLNIKTEGMNSLDKVTIYVFDEDLILNTNTGKYEYLSEFEELNLGTKEDVVFELK